MVAHVRITAPHRNSPGRAAMRGRGGLSRAAPSASLSRCAGRGQGALKESFRAEVQLAEAAAGDRGRASEAEAAAVRPRAAADIDR